MKGQEPMFSTAKNDGPGRDNWRTPGWLVDGLGKRLHFTGDAAAEEHNTFFRRWMGPGSPQPDALAVDWGRHDGRGFPFWWCNPPFSIWEAFAQKAHDEALAGNAATMMLLGGRIDTGKFHRLIYNRRDPRSLQRVGVAWQAIESRLKFTLPDGTTTGPAPFPTLLACWYPVKLGSHLHIDAFRRMHIHGSRGIEIHESDGRDAMVWRDLIAVPGRREPKEKKAA